MENFNVGEALDLNKLIDALQGAGLGVQWVGRHPNLKPMTVGSLDLAELLPVVEGLARRSLPVDAAGIKTWQERRAAGGNFERAMLDEISDLRAALARAGSAAPAGQQAEPVATGQNVVSEYVGKLRSALDAIASRYEDSEIRAHAFDAYNLPVPAEVYAAPVSAAPAAPTAELIEIGNRLANTVEVVAPTMLNSGTTECLKRLVAEWREVVAAPTAAEWPSLLQQDLDNIADELEQEAANYEGDFADTVNGCVEALRLIADRHSPTKEGAGEVDAKDAALEQAAQICDDLHHNWRWDDEPDSNSGPRECARAIRAVMSAAQTQPKDATDTKEGA